MTADSITAYIQYINKFIVFRVLGHDASSQWPLHRNVRHFLLFKKPLWGSLCVSRGVCPPPGYDAQWCHQILEKQVKKRNIPAAGMWRTYAHCQPFSAPWGYHAAVIDRKSWQQNRETSIYLSAACLFQKTDRIKGCQAWCTWQTTVADNRRICRNESS